jgi:SAM-dependent methyltransferase
MSPSRRSRILPSDDARWVFNRLAAAYPARPGYPAALVERLAELAGGPGTRVVDLGAGTGLLALPLAARGLAVTAVEPARAMLDALRGTPGVVPVHATAEQSGLAAGSADLVLLADALHWIDPAAGAAEARRLLAHPGVLAVVTPRLADTPFLRALSARIAGANAKAQPQPPPVALFFSEARLPPPAVEPFEHAVALDAASLDGVLRSLSYVGPALGPAALDALLTEVRALAEAHGGAVWKRDLELAWARRD